MSTRCCLWSAVMGLVIGVFAGGAFAQCLNDGDGDGRGNGCCLGNDCRGDGNAAIYPGALELCDGLDNDCSSPTADGWDERGRGCETGLQGVCGRGQLQCVSGAFQCQATLQPGAQAEVCDCKDNDCDGLVDEDCADADQDNVPYSCDCDDTQAAVSINHGGKPLCMHIDPITLPTYRAAFTIIRAYHPEGIYSLVVEEDHDFDNAQTFICQRGLCDVVVGLSDHSDPRVLNVTLNKCSGIGCGAGLKVGRRGEIVKAVCEREYCPPDPAIGRLAEFMRRNAYRECVTGKYLEFAQIPDRKATQKEFINASPAGYAQGSTIHFFDIVHNEPARSVHRLMGENDGEPCSACDSWPDWCPSELPLNDPQRRTNYRFVQRLFEETFGLSFNFVYEARTVNYRTDVGMTCNTSTGQCRINTPTSYANTLPEDSIVHYALETYDGMPVIVQANGAHAAELNEEPGDIDLMSRIIRGSQVFTHEWAHTLDFPHSSVGAAVDLAEAGKRAALDGVMDNSLSSFTRLMDLADPLERFGLEPLGGYPFGGGFGEAYSSGIIGTEHLPTCGSVDPAISAGGAADGGGVWFFDLTLTNYGTTPTGYVTLQATDDTYGALLAERTIGWLPPGQTKTHRVSVQKATVPAGSVTFVLDPADAIKPEASATCTSSNTCESNNRRSVPTPRPPVTRTASDFESTGSGSIIDGSVADTRVSDNHREGLQEATAGLVHTWRFDNVPAGVLQELIFEGGRPGNTDGDNFNFFYCSGACGAVTDFVQIPGAVIQDPIKREKTKTVGFGTGGLSGSVFMQIRDTAGGTRQDNVYIDYLAIRTTFQ